jgi:hypothetical protein
MRARTGLWEPRVGNDPGPPGPKACWQIATVAVLTARRGTSVCIVNQIGSRGGVSGRSFKQV